MVKFGLALILVSLNVFALEVDEKLTVRVVKTSESRKTIMINRGIEDGLAENDHARFIVTAGIVARAVCVKVSPTRSVWSVYRLVNADFIQPDSVMTLKITPPVKVTKDESQTLVQEDTPSRPVGAPSELGIPLAEGAQDVSAEQLAMDKAEIKSLGEEDRPATLVEKNLEAYSMLNISALSASTKSDTGESSFSNSQSYYHIGLGGEYYPRNEREWFSKFSVNAELNLMKQDNQGYLGSSTTNDVTEFAVGANWHPTKLPSAAYEFIPYFHADLSFSTLKSTFTPGSENPGGPTFSSTGSGNGLSLGFGYKYYTARGFGIRALFDYYLRNEKYKADEALLTHAKTVRGPRLMLGISYRF